MFRTDPNLHTHPMYKQDRPLYPWHLFAYGITWAAVLLVLLRIDNAVDGAFEYVFIYWSASVAGLFYHLGKDAGRCQFWRYMDLNGRLAWWEYRSKLSEISRWDWGARREINPDRYGNSM